MDPNIDYYPPPFLTSPIPPSTCSLSADSVPAPAGAPATAPMTAMPPLAGLPLPSGPAAEDSLASMIMSWYQSGFYTGYYQGLMQGRQQR